MANLFVSHRGTDTVEAERLAKELQAQGHKVWLDVWDIGIGDSIVARIDKGLAEAAYLILCYSGASVLAPWMKREWMSALARQLDGKGVKVLPVRLTGGDPPAILADVRYADLVRDWNKGLAELLRAIR